MHFLLILSLFAFYYLSGGSKSDNDKRTRKNQVVLMGLCLFLFAAFRSYEVGTDLPGYFRFYHEDGEMSFTDIMFLRQGRDPFFHSFLHVLYQFSPNPQLMLVTIGAIVAIGFSYLAYQEKGNVLLIYVLFVGFRIYSFTLSGLRQAVALSIIYVAYVMLRKEKYWVYAALTIFASQFHTSALLFILAFPIVKFKNTSLFVIAALSIGMLNLATGGAIAQLLRSVAFEERFEGYSLNQQFQGGLTFLIYFLVFLFAIGMSKTMKQKDSSYPESLRILTAGFTLSFIGQTVENVFRMAYYFNCTNIILLPQIISAMFVQKKEANIVHFLVAVLFAAQYLIFGQGADIENYSFYWEVPNLY